MPADDLTYNPDTPPERQISSWACSIRATRWILESLGIHVDVGALQSEMVPTYVTPKDGLLDGHGIGLAEVLRRHLPPETPVEVLWAPSWDDVVARAGRGPIGIGAGQPLYHWLNVARVLSPGVLDAPNPAPNYPPGAPLHDNLTRAEFDQYAPWALVFVQVAPAAKPAPTPAPPAPAFNVGSGILQHMVRNNEQPASDEVFFGEGGRGWSQAMSNIGRAYVWIPSLGRCVVSEGWGAS